MSVTRTGPARECSSLTQSRASGSSTCAGKAKSVTCSCPPHRRRPGSRCCARSLARLVGRRNVPEFDGGVIAPRRQQLTIGTERQANHMAIVTFKSRFFLAHPFVPKLDGLVTTARRQQCVIGTECHGHNKIIVSLERGLFPTRFDVPQFGRV